MAEAIFWHDEIKKLRREPAKRLKTALKELPLPRAFKEAQIACRALVREKMQKHESYEELLRGLYQLLVWEDLLLATPYIEVIRMPGYNVARSIPKAVIRGLDTPYDRIGYEKLAANKTDVKWFVAAWGEPSSHVSAQAFHSDLWGSYVDKYRKKQKADEERFFKSLTTPTRREKAAPKKSDLGNLLTNALGSFKFIK